MNITTIVADEPVSSRHSAATAVRKARKPAKKPATRKPPKKPESKAASKAEATSLPQSHPDSLPDTWIAQFIYAAPDGGARLSLMTIKAATANEARAIAAAHPPAEEFMVTVYPRSDEQFLDQVRLKALIAVGKRD